MHQKNILLVLYNKSGSSLLNQVPLSAHLPPPSPSLPLSLSPSPAPLNHAIAYLCPLLLSTAFLIYVAASISIVLVLILHFEPLYGQTNILIYLGICSLMGALTVIAHHLNSEMMCSIHLVKEAFISHTVNRVGCQHKDCRDCH